MSPTAKVILGTSLTALAAVGIYIVTRGKKRVPTVIPETRPDNTPLPDYIQEVQQLTTDAFKQAGNKFEKGVAKLNNGENYTGTLVQKTKDFRRIEKRYKDGILVRKNTYDMQTGKKLHEKSYVYSEVDGKLVTVKEDGNTIYQRYIDGFACKDFSYHHNGDKSIISYFYYSQKGSKHYEYINGKRILRAEQKPNSLDLIFYRDNGTKEFVLKNCENGSTSSQNCGHWWANIIEIYDEKGKFIKTLERMDGSEYAKYRNKYLQFNSRTYNT